MHKKILFILIFLLLLVTIFKIDRYRKIEYVKENYNEIKINNIWILEINKINVKEVITLSDISSKKIKGIVLFKNYGRPNIKYSNTVIGAHSGNSSNSYFTDLDKLVIGDKIVIYYEGLVYNYLVISNYQVIETDLTPLNNIEDKTTITLMTCNENNPNYRIIVVGELESID